MDTKEIAEKYGIRSYPICSFVGSLMVLCQDSTQAIEQEDIEKTLKGDQVERSNKHGRKMGRFFWFCLACLSAGLVHGCTGMVSNHLLEQDQENTHKSKVRNCKQKKKTSKEERR